MSGRSQIPEQSPRKREQSGWWRLQRLLLVAGLALFIVGIVATVGAPALDFGLTGSPDDDSGGEPPEPTEDDEDDTNGDEEPNEADEGTADDADTTEETPPADSEDDGDTDDEGTGDETDETGEPEGADDGSDDETYTYSVTIEVTYSDGVPAENEPVQLHPVGEEPEEYATDENGEVTIEFEQSEPDESVEYTLAIRSGERVVGIEQGTQTESVTLAASSDDPDEN